MNRLFTLAVVLCAFGARAQLTAANLPMSPAPAAGTAPVRWPDVAFGDGVWLAVSGAGNIQGQYFTAAGDPEGAAFTVDVDAFHAQCPRVGFVPQSGAFLVTWHASISMNATRVRGRLLRHGMPALTQDFDISPDGSNWEMGPSIATGANELLVAWQVFGTTKIQAQRISSAGAKVGGVIDVDPSAGYERDPAVGYDPVSDTYLVAYAGCVGNDDCFVRAQRVDAATGALIGTPLTLDASINAGYVPEIAYDANARRWLVVWYRATGGARSLEGRTVAADGTLGPRRTVSSMYASYDANSLAWSPQSGTFVVVTHATEQDVAVELDGEGRPLNLPGLLWGPTGVTGNFNPRITARSGAPDFLAVTSSAFASLTAQRLTTATRTLVVDAGTDAGVDAGVDAGAADAGTVTDAGTADAGTMPPASDAGTGPPVTGACGCHAAPGLALAVLALVLRRRRAARDGVTDSRCRCGSCAW